MPMLAFTNADAGVQIQPMQVFTFPRRRCSRCRGVRTSRLAGPIPLPEARASGPPQPWVLPRSGTPRSPYPAIDLELADRTVFDVLVRAADRFGEKPALQVRRGGRWIRYTYRDLVDATGSVMQRFLDRGLQPGDRVAITGESAPEWGVTFFAAMRAGLTAVPLDPQLPPADAWAAARFAEAKSFKSPMLQARTPGVLTERFRRRCRNRSSILRARS